MGLANTKSVTLLKPSNKKMEANEVEFLPHGIEIVAGMANGDYGEHINKMVKSSSL